MDSKTLEKLDETGVKILEQLGEATTSGIELIEKEAPQLCYEIIMIGRVYNCSLVLGGLAALIFFSFIFNRAFRKLAKSLEEDKNFPPTPQNFSIIIQLILSGILSIVGFAMFMSNFYYACLTLFAPRLYLLEYISDLIKK